MAELLPRVHISGGCLVHKSFLETHLEMSRSDVVDLVGAAVLAKEFTLEYVRILFLALPGALD